jgi:predicted ATPase/DNA-binding SARP family transcriptional activator
MEFRILGPVEVVADGMPVHLGGRQRRTVLAILLVHAGESVSTDRLVDELWGDTPPGAARKTVQAHVAHLRKALNIEGDILVSADDGYVIRIDPDLVDAQRFERMVEEGRSLRASEPSRSADKLSEALGIFRGAPLAGVADDAFSLRVEASRLEDVRLAAVEDHLESRLAAGDAAAVIAEADRLVAQHPLRERSWALLMLALYRTGRQSEALRAFARVRQLLAEDLGIEPSHELQALEQRILSQDLEEQILLQVPQLMAGADDGLRVSGNLPSALTAFVGRAQDLESLEKLAKNARLITLVGEGGVGKSRMAVELGRRLAPRYRDGVWLIELSGVEDPDYVAASLISVLRDTRPGATDFDVIEFLRRRELVLLLDNCERIVDGVALLAEQVLQQAPHVTIAATSREPLGCRGEVLWRVRPLDVPPIETSDEDATVLSKYDSVLLFAKRAAEVVPGFQLDADSAPRVARVVSMVDGLPLAIELAAAQMRRSTLPDILSNLETHHELFVANSPAIPRRHRALRHTLDWSYELLATEEREIFGRLGAFFFDFPIEAAEIVCGGAGIDERDVPRLLQGLVDKSLVLVDPKSGRTRFRLLDTVRAYAYDKIAQGHAAQHERGFIIGLAQRTDPALRGTTEQMWAWLLGGDRELIRATLAATAASFAEDQSGFLAGAAAALLTRTGRVAFLGGIDPESVADVGGQKTAVFELIQRFRVGFRAGVHHIDTEIDIVDQYMTSRLDFTVAFRNPLRARQLSSELYGSDVDVIFHAAGDVGRQVFEQAHRASEDTGLHRWVIGVDHDEYLTVAAELKPHVAASAIKQIPSDPYVELKRAMASGTAIETPVFTLANQGVGLATSGAHLEQHLGTLADLRNEIIDGQLDLGA